MIRSSSRSLDRKKLLADPILLLTIIAIVLFLTLFIAYPLFSLLQESVYNNNRISLDAFGRVLGLASFRGVIGNTLLLGVLSGIISTLIGFLFAYVDTYVKVRFKQLFKVVSVLPVVSPPFVLSLSVIMLFGRSGIITRSLLGIYDSNVHGLHGILVVQVLTFFPICYLILRSLLKNIDPSLEEAVRNMGASRWKAFTTVTLPLLLPGLGNAFLITFIESVTDFANPMMIGGDFGTLATSIFLQVTGAFDVTGAAAMAVILLSISIGLFVLQKYWLERKSYATLTGKASRERMMIEDKSVAVPLFSLCAIITVGIIIMYAMIPFGALFRLWGRDYTLVLDHFRFVINIGIRPFTDSLRMSSIAAPVTALMSMIIAYLIVKRKFFGKSFIEFISIFAMAVPGTVLGIGFIRAFNGGLFNTGFLAITGTGIIIIIAFITRSLPVGVRSGVAALRQIDRSIEESAYDMGASSFKVFTSVTLPLIKDSFFSGLVTAFVRSITATSAVVFLISPHHQLITPQIMAQAEIGRFGVASAYATIMIAIVYGSISLMNLFLKFFGVSRSVGEVN